jgi:hypothetical protein
MNIKAKKQKLKSLGGTFPQTYFLLKKLKNNQTESILDRDLLAGS